MVRKRFVVIILATLGMLALGAARVNGTTYDVTATFTGVDSATAMHFYRNAYGQTANEYVYVGAYRWDGTFATNNFVNPAPWDVNPFHTFCIDFVQNINFNQTYGFNKLDLKDAPKPTGGLAIPGNPPDGMGVDKANAIEELWGLNYGSLGTDPDRLAGFQMAIWEIIYENDSSTLQLPSAYDVSSGNFHTTETDGAFTSAINYGNAYLASIFNGNVLKTNDLANLKAFASDTVQDQVVLAPEDAEPQEFVVPLPTSAYAGAVLVAFSGLMTFRRRYAQV